MLKKAMSFVLVMAVFAIGFIVATPNHVHANTLAFMVEVQNSPPGVQADLQPVQLQAEVEFRIVQHDITQSSLVTNEDGILMKGMPPRVMEQTIKVDEERLIPSKYKKPNIIKGKMLLQRQYKLSCLYSQFSMNYRG